MPFFKTRKSFRQGGEKIISNQMCWQLLPDLGREGDGCEALACHLCPWRLARAVPPFTAFHTSLTKVHKMRDETPTQLHLLSCKNSVCARGINSFCTPLLASFPFLQRCNDADERRCPLLNQLHQMRGEQRTGARSPISSPERHIFPCFFSSTLSCDQRLTLSPFSGSLYPILLKASSAGEPDKHPAQHLTKRGSG